MAQPVAPLVTLTGVSKLFEQGTKALDGVDMRLAEGEFASLLGPSGCGKSTLLRIVAGLAEPSAGAIAWLGDRAPARGEIGFVFQEPTLMPWAKVFDNVALPFRLVGAGGGEVAARVEAAIAGVGLAGFEDAYPRQLSGGMRMRVSIARALVTAPRLLLLDEPFAALDEITRFRLNDDLRRLWQERRPTVLFVTHSVYEAVYLSQRVMVMSERPGRIVADMAIDLPAARSADLRTSPAYGEVCRALSRRLAAEVAA